MQRFFFLPQNLTLNSNFSFKAKHSLPNNINEKRVKPVSVHQKTNHNSINMKKKTTHFQTSNSATSTFKYNSVNHFHIKVYKYQSLFLVQYLTSYISFIQ